MRSKTSQKFSRPTQNPKGFWQDPDLNRNPEICNWKNPDSINGLICYFKIIKNFALQFIYMRTECWEGVEKALKQDDLTLVSGRNNPVGVSIVLYEGDIIGRENPDVGKKIAEGNSMQENKQMKKHDMMSDGIEGPPSIPIAIGRAGADYLGIDKPKDQVEYSDGLTDIYFDRITGGILGEYKNGEYILQVGREGEYRGTGEDLEEAYEDFQSELASLL